MENKYACESAREKGDEQAQRRPLVAIAPNTLSHTTQTHTHNSSVSVLVSPAPGPQKKQTPASPSPVKWGDLYDQRAAARCVVQCSVVMCSDVW
jgi:hypothetical protein